MVHMQALPSLVYSREPQQRNATLKQVVAVLTAKGSIVAAT